MRISDWSSDGCSSDLQRHFLTWGIAIAVFGMRIVFPLVIVMIAASLGPIEAVKLAINDPEQYEVILNGAHIGLMGFGGAFLGMVGLKYFFDADKEVDWIAAIERPLAKVGDRKSTRLKSSH